MTHRPISISMAPYDGYPVERALESLVGIGATHVEPAFVVGFTERFDESAFMPTRAAEYEAALRQHGVQCYAMSAHIDLGRADAVKVFTARMDFARRIGARVINTFASTRRHEKRFYANVEQLARHAEAIDLHIGLENPSDGSDGLFNVAADAPALLARIGSPRIGLNYDVGSTVSHRPNVDPTKDALTALPHCIHMHVKDVRRNRDGWFFTPIGKGDIGFARLLSAIARTDVPLSVEIPMRVHRMPDAKPGRSRYRVPIADIETTLTASLRYVRKRLGQ